MRSLNPFATVTAISGAISCELLLKYHLVILTQGTIDRWILYDEFCRAQSPPIGVIIAQVFGHLASLFVDFGPVHHYNPTTGTTEMFPITRITAAGRVEGESFPFQNGDFVRFHQINRLSPDIAFPISNVDGNAFDIDVKGSGAIHTSNGFVSLATKRPEMHHQSLRECLVDPEKKIAAEPQEKATALEIHTMFNRLHEFQQQMGYTPQLCHFDTIVMDRPEIEATAKAALRHHHYHHDKTILPPLCLILGGLVGHQVMKWVGLAPPLNQLMYLDPAAVPVVQNNKSAPPPPRRPKICIVGAGTTGRELVRVFALIGIPCTILDGDSTKVVRTEDSKPVSMNAHSEDVLNDAFWQEIDVVISTVVSEYIDQQCRYFEKPRILCHASGTHGSVHVAVPHVSSIRTDPTDVVQGNGRLPSTSSIAAGLACIEALKILQHTCRSLLRNTTFDTHSNVWRQTAPEPPPCLRQSCHFDPVTGDAMRVMPENFTAWDLIKLPVANPTLAMVIQHIQHQFQVRVVSITTAASGNYPELCCLYSSAKSSSHLKQRGSMR